MRSTAFLFLAGSVLMSTTSRAQDLNEAYNLSKMNFQGTARSIGFGGALGSVGGDFSSLSVNPAGIGVYRTSEMMVTPSLKINGASTNYQGTTTADNNTRFNVNNFGLVFTHAPKGKRYDRSNWKSFSFAFGMNRGADFNRTYSYSGVNNTSSATQAMASEANLDTASVSSPGSLGYLGYNAYLINNVNGTYQSIVPYAGGIQQTKSITETGHLDEYVITLGGNYKEKLLIGMTVGFPQVYYNRYTEYSESLAAGNPGTSDNFNSFTYSNNLNISGGGVNVKVGAIYKLTNFLRLGASFHSPTYYTLTDVSTPSIISTVNGSTTSMSTNDYLPENRFDYNFTTPWKAVGSATFIIKALGFVTADYEYVDYSTMKYTYPDGFDNNANMTFRQEANIMNQKISSTYQAASNLRLGAEIKLTRYFMVRGGVGYYGNPYKDANMNMQRTDLSAGLGFRGAHFFADFAVAHSMYTVKESPYTIDYSGLPNSSQVAAPVATTNFNLNNVALTMGIKF